MVIVGRVGDLPARPFFVASLSGGRAAWQVGLIYTHDVIADEVVFLRIKRPGEKAASEDQPQEARGCETARAAA